MHHNQADLGDEVARSLITSQFPQWKDQLIRRVNSSGTVNAIFRIGDGFAARFPLVGSDPETLTRLLEAEARASAELAESSPFPTPLPIGLGRPGAGFPLPWSVQTWLPGADANGADPSHSEAFARDLARLIAALRAADTRGCTFAGTNRGGDLGRHDERVELHLRNSEHLLDVPRLARLWQRFRDLPRTDSDVMSHGDLTPGNVLVADGRLAGVLDCGGFGPADPALDLIAGWHLLEEGPRAVLRAELASGDLEWERAKAWAFEQALAAAWYYLDSNPAMSRMGRRTLRRIVEATPD